MVSKIIFCVTNITRIHHGVVLGGFGCPYQCLCFIWCFYFYGVFTVNLICSLPNSLIAGHVLQD